jgi:hypothetical protein
MITNKKAHNFLTARAVWHGCLTIIGNCRRQLKKHYYEHFKFYPKINFSSILQSLLSSSLPLVQELWPLLHHQ